MDEVAHIAVAVFFGPATLFAAACCTAVLPSAVFVAGLLQLVLAGGLILAAVRGGPLGAAAMPVRELVAGLLVLGAVGGVLWVQVSCGAAA